MKNEKEIFEEVAKNEKPITAGELLEEITPLLDDYFIGKILFDGQNVFYTLPNGQKFAIKAEIAA